MSFQINQSVASTRFAPLRSAAKENAPSQAPTSRKVLSVRSAGSWYCRSERATSMTPLVTRPWPRSMEWNHLIRATSSASETGVAAAAGVDIGTPELRDPNIVETQTESENVDIAEVYHRERGRGMNARRV